MRDTLTALEVLASSKIGIQYNFSQGTCIQLVPFTRLQKYKFKICLFDIVHGHMKICITIVQLTPVRRLKANLVPKHFFKQHYK